MKTFLSMKNFTFCIGILMVFSCFSVNAQKPSTADSVAKLYKRFFTLESAAEKREKTLADSLNTLNNTYKSLENLIRKDRSTFARVSKTIKQLTNKDLLDAKNRYETNRTSIQNTADFMEAFNNGLNGVEASLTFTDYFNAITELNNPTNSELGFSLEQEMMRILNKNIQLGRRKKPKFLRIISGIIKNPITQAVTSIVPGVSSIQSVLNFVNGVAMGERDINVGNIMGVQNGALSYVKHYEQLSKASTNLDQSINSLKVRAEGLARLSNGFVKDMVMPLHGVKKVDVEKASLNDVLNKYYTYRIVSERIKQIEGQNKTRRSLNYDKLVNDPHLGYSLLNRQKVEFMSEELEKISIEYLAALDEHHKNIVRILKGAVKLNGDPAKIDKKIKTLNQQFERVKQTYKKNVNIKAVKERADRIPAY
ncbi:hypothetical protein [Microscilla marina]|uniref:Lipoprotein, putative n=1 Tax=Microscilla marina ATCC 23134 TaxID=313606 RepID=A1ZSP6_MICM2|nr:hypothetical protein [Microscilla marina]EAY26626.1 lipoprotein, putative [Microscilla marina ATCC 23134]